MIHELIIFLNENTIYNLENFEREDKVILILCLL
jgi:hypothetical protein